MLENAVEQSQFGITAAKAIFIVWKPSIPETRDRINYSPFRRHKRLFGTAWRGLAAA